MYFKITYTIFIVSQLLFGSFYIGPITPRQTMAIIMFFVCWKNNSIKIDIYFKIYIIFILGYIIAQLYTGYVSEMVRLLFGYYLVSYITYQSTKLLFYKERNTSLLMCILFIVGIADGVVTIGQMYQVPFAHEVSLLFGNNKLGDIYDSMSERNQDNMMGYTIPGLFGPVPNGYFLSAITLLCFYNKRAKVTIVNMLLVIFFIFTTFIVQERTALIVCIILSLFSLYKFLFSQEETSIFKKILVFSIILFGCFYIVPELVDTIIQGDSRYTKGFSLSDERGEINQRAINYLLWNPLGGLNEFTANNHYPHNIFINAFMFGGIFGGIGLMFLFFKQTFLSVKIILSDISSTNVQQFVFVMMFVCYTLNSLTHNLSIVTGEPTMWLLWGAIIGLKEYGGANSKKYKILKTAEYENCNS